jgi:hypothetical protein
LFRLNKQQIGFMESGVAITAASHDIENRPVLGRMMGCRVAADGARITLFLSRVKYPLLLDAFRRSGKVAASFTEPSSNQSIQVKGEGAELVEMLTGDPERIAACFDLFTADLERINIPRVLAEAVQAFHPGDIAAISFTPTVAFIQTPGAKAGSPIAAA